MNTKQEMMNKPKSVLAKFVCDKLDTGEYGDTIAKFSACVDDSGDGEDFTPYTPWGNLTMGITDKTKASVFFEEGELYYLTFTPVNNGKI